jgi:hypothetical protein
MNVSQEMENMKNIVKGSKYSQGNCQDGYLKGSGECCYTNKNY